jgi:hypothetical protein
MKKLTTLMFAILSCTFLANATIFYVDNVNGNDQNDGQSWATAFKNITSALGAVKIAPYDVTVDDIFVKGGNYNTAAKISVEYDNLYGGFEGTETLPSQRPLADNDGNGIVEPWEFKYPSIITSTFDATGSSAFSISNASNGFKNTLNGFTITQTGTCKPNDNAKTYKEIQLFSSNAILEKVILKNCDIQFPQATNITIGGILIDAVGGLVKHCLIENNKVYLGITASSSTYSGPVLQISKGLVIGCVFRNNKVVYQAVGAPATNGTLFAIEGALVYFKAGVVGTDICMSNCLVYNNEASFDNNAAVIGGTSSWGVIARNGALIKMTYTGTPASTDSVVSCTIANNKITNMGGSILYANSSPTKLTNVINNAFWNNKNEAGDKNLQMLSSFITGNNIGYCLNNAFTLAGPTNSVNGWIANNLGDLSAINADANGPNFVKPTLTTGVIDITTNADELNKANWSLATGSYLISKGFALPKRSVDLNGNNYAATRSIGAYEYQGASGIHNVRNDVKFVAVVNRKLVFQIEGFMQVFNEVGKLQNQRNICVGQEIGLSAGVYLVKVKNANGIYVQKIIL